MYKAYTVSIVQFSSVAQLGPTLCDLMDCNMLGFPVHHQLPELTQTHVRGDGIPSNHLILCCPLLLWPQACPASGSFPISQFLLHQVAKLWSFSLGISPSKEYSGQIFFRIDWFHLLKVQRMLKSLLQHHSSKPSFLQHSTFFTVQLSHPYMTTGKTITLITQTFVSKVMSLLFNMLSRFVIAFLPRSKCLLISWLVTICSDFGAQETKVSHCFHCFPIF